MTALFKRHSTSPAEAPPTSISTITSIDVKVENRD